MHRKDKWVLEKTKMKQVKRPEENFRQDQSKIWNVSQQNK